MKRIRPSAIAAFSLVAALLMIAACFTNDATGPKQEVTRPAVQSTYPQNSAADITRSGPYWILFTQHMNAQSVEAGVTVSPALPYFSQSWDGDTLFVTPGSLLTANMRYTITIPGSSKALSGKTIGTDYAVSFTTTAENDNTPPTVLSASPANEATNVSGVQPIEITFSEPMNDSYTRSAITVTPSPTDQWMEWQATKLVINHSAFPQNTPITVAVSTQARDLAGNQLGSQYSCHFTTMTDNTRPYLASASPANNATGVSTSLSRVVLAFSEPMDQSSFDMPPEMADARLTQAIANEPSFNSDYSQITVPFAKPLLPGCTYWVQFFNVKDGGGNIIDPNPTPYQFTTAGTTSYYPVKTSAVWHFLSRGTYAVTRSLDHYSQMSGTFDETFIGDPDEIEGITYFKKTANEIQHLGRSNYDHGTFQFTMMWNQPLPYIKLPLSDFLGQSWPISATSSVGDTLSVSLSGHIEIEPSTVDLVSSSMHGTFKGCYVHHLYADLVISHNGTPVDEQNVHQIMWLAPGVGLVQMIDSGGGDPDTLRVVDWNDLY